MASEDYDAPAMPPSSPAREKECEVELRPMESEAELLFPWRSTGGRARKRRQARAQSLALLKHPDDPSCTFSDRASHLAASLLQRQDTVWLTAAQLEAKTLARERTFSRRRLKRARRRDAAEDLDRALQEHRELAVDHVASHGGADFRPTVLSIGKSAERLQRQQEGGSHPSRTARAARRSRRLEAAAAEFFSFQYGPPMVAAESDSSPPPSPAPTYTAPEAPRPELERLIGLLDLEIGVLQLKDHGIACVVYRSLIPLSGLPG